MLISGYGKAIQFYAADYDDNLPTITTNGSTAHPFDFRWFWERLADYYDIDTPDYYIDSFQPAMSKTNAALRIPAAVLCPAARLSYDAALETLKSQNLLQARLSRGGAYQAALYSQYLDESFYPKHLGKVESPSSYFFMEDAGFNDRTDDREYPYWRCEQLLDGHYFWGHGCYYNVGFLDGHVEGFPRKRRYNSDYASLDRNLRMD